MIDILGNSTIFPRGAGKMNHLVSILFSPSETFERLRGKGGWIIPFISLMVITVIIVFLQMPMILQTAEETAELMGGTETAGVNIILAIAQVTGYLSAIFSVAFTMFVGGLLLLLVNVIVRGEATYMQLSKVALLASVPKVLGGLLTGILLRMTGAESITDVILSAGALIMEKKGFLFSLANMINPFTLWSLFLVIIGTSVMVKKGRSSVAIWIISGWLLIGLISAALSTIGQ